MKLTKEDILKIQQEIDFRKGEHRTELLTNLKEARAQGDLSENFEYTMAKRLNNQNNSRVRYLENMIKNAEIYEDKAALDEVGINKEVTLYIPEDDATEVYKIVTSIRGNSMQGRISEESPLGKALMGHHVRDTVSVKVNENYSYDVEIQKIVYVEDDLSDDIRQY